MIEGPSSLADSPKKASGCWMGERTAALNPKPSVLNIVAFRVKSPETKKQPEMIQQVSKPLNRLNPKPFKL